LELGGNVVKDDDDDEEMDFQMPTTKYVFTK
jgi:hypothetical protein